MRGQVSQSPLSPCPLRSPTPAACSAVVWQMLLVTVGITYCCTGMAYVLSQILDPSAAQLSAAVLALINTLIARQAHASGLLWVAQQATFARWVGPAVACSPARQPHHIHARRPALPPPP